MHPMSIIRLAACAAFCVAGNAAAQSYATLPPDSASSAPLRDVPANVRTQPLAAGQVTHAVQVATPPGQAAVTVRSIQPSTVLGDYHIDFAALDTDGDGFISRAEAQANPSLAAEFDALDSAHRGKLARAQLAGWLRD